MKVRDLLETHDLELTMVVAGDLERAIRWVHPSEVYPPANYLRGGEVVLTSGQWIRDGVQVSSYLRELALKHVVAVGWGLLGNEDEAPSEFVTTGAELGLTCFVVPTKTSFIEIVEAFVLHMRREWEGPLRRHVARYDAIVSALQVEQSVQSILRVVSAEMGLAVHLSTEDDEITTTEACHRFPIMGGRFDHKAELIIPSTHDDLDIDQRSVLTLAMPLIALELARIRSLHEKDLWYAAELFDWLQASDVPASSVRSRLQMLGLEDNGRLAGLVVRGSPSDSPLCSRLQKQLGVGGICARRGQTVVAIVDVPHDSRKFLIELHERLNREVWLGMGAPGSADRLSLSLAQADKAVEVAMRENTQGWVDYDQLRSPAMLLTLGGSALIEAAAQALLEPILAHDAKYRTELFRTLDVFLECDTRPAKTADAMHIHTNTLRYRLGQIMRLTGKDTSQTLDRVDLYLAVQVLRSPN